MVKYICDVCGMMYKQRRSLEIHIGIHYGISPFMCNICDKTFTQKIGLKKHLLIHIGIPQYQVLEEKALFNLIFFFSCHPYNFFANIVYIYCESLKTGKT